MAQGQLKPKSIVQQEKIGKKSSVKHQRGMRIAPKQNSLVKRKMMQKKLQARNIQNTEAQMAVKAQSTGKLTIMKKTAIEAKKDQDVKKSKSKK
ncbi:hypothetical protein BC833DRAFT_587296 [Globomyces pollinis-pini]|nr:hypothetical protein BC833DRAFT_587296 [Globomyces pollinis-pini]